VGVSSLTPHPHPLPQGARELIGDVSAQGARELTGDISAHLRSVPKKTCQASSDFAVKLRMM